MKKYIFNRNSVICSIRFIDLVLPHDWYILNRSSFIRSKNFDNLVIVHSSVTGFSQADSTVMCSGSNGNVCIDVTHTNAKLFSTVVVLIDCVKRNDRASALVRLLCISSMNNSGLLHVIERTAQIVLIVLAHILKLH